MTKPENGPIEITAETQMERWRERFSRRQLIQLFGGAGVATVAGCGGGGQGATGPGAQQTPQQGTPTESRTGTPAETVRTPAGKIAITDRWIHDITTDNFEKLNPNPWNAKTGTNPSFQELSLGDIIETPPGTDKNAVLDVLVPYSAKTFELDVRENVLTIHLHDGITWGDGTPFDAENVVMHVDILRAQIELAQASGESSESTLPSSLEMVDDRTLEAQLLPGNPVLRLQEALFQGGLTNVSDTHPKHHRRFVESIREASTLAETRTTLRELSSATFPTDALPDFALGPLEAARWDPEKIEFETRPNWPWGLDFHPDMERTFGGARVVSVAEETNVLNAAIGGQKDWATLPNKETFERFDRDKWSLMEFPVAAQNALFFSPTSILGKKTETARKLRQGIAFLVDNEEFARINDAKPSYEVSAGYALKRDFEGWIGEDTFRSWTNYGKQDTGYLFEEKGYRNLREAGFERNKNGLWEDAADGTILAPETIFFISPSLGLTNLSNNNLVEQLNRHGIRASGQIPSDEEFETRATNFEFDLATMRYQGTVKPHPYFGYREDMGIGSRDGLPTGINTSDWRNGYRRVDVPMPVGDPDGELTTYDWDKNVLEMTQIQSAERMKERAEELSWVMNQWMPGVFLNVMWIYAATRTDRIEVSEKLHRPLRKALWRSAPKSFLVGAGFWQPA